MKMKLFFIFLISVSLESLAAFYKCTNKDGKITYSQSPCPETVESKKLDIKDSSEKIEIPSSTYIKPEIPKKVELSPQEIEKINMAAQKEAKITSLPEKPQELIIILSFYNRFREAHDLASKTPRISLPVPISRMQDIKQEAEKISLPECYQKTKSDLVFWMKILIDKMINFMAGSGSSADLEAALKDIEATQKRYDFWISIPIECK